MSEQKLNLYKKLHQIQTKVLGLGKDAKSFGYQYVSGTKVISEIKPLMNEYGLLLKQEVLSFENTRQDYQTKNGSKSEILTKVDMRFTWIDAETGEKDENLFGANGQNDWEKGFGSALTYAERYFLLKFFHISTDEDDIDNPERKTAKAIAQTKKSFTEQDIKIIKGKIIACANLQDLTKLYNSDVKIKTNKELVDVVKDRSRALKEAQ